PAALSEALAAEQRRLGLGPRAEANARALAEGALAVVAGQQPGLLASPLLVLHKAAGAIAWAERLSERWKRPVVPVFWVAAEDHGWAEVNRATVLDAAGGLVDLALPVAGDRRSVRDVPVPADAWRSLLEALARALAATERASEAVSLAAPPEGADVGSA